MKTRVLRIVEYIGEPAEIEEQLRRSLGEGAHRFGGSVEIRVGTVGNYPEILNSEVSDGIEA